MGPPKKPKDKDEKVDKDQNFSDIRVIHKFDEEDKFDIDSVKTEENPEKKEENPEEEENTKKRKREDSETEIPLKPDDKKQEIMSNEEKKQNEKEVDHNTDD